MLKSKFYNYKPNRMTRRKHTIENIILFCLLLLPTIAIAGEDVDISTAGGHTISIKNPRPNIVYQEQQAKNQYFDYFNLNGLYFKFGAGLNKNTPTPVRCDQYKGCIKTKELFPQAEIGIGYQINSDARVDLIINHYFGFNSRENTEDFNNGTFHIDHKTKLSTLTLNGYHNTFSIGSINHFVGAGIGINNLQETAKGHSHRPEDDMFEEDTALLSNASSKRVNKFVWKLTTGFDFKVSDNVKAEIAYNYFDLNSNKPRIINGAPNLAKRYYKVHNISFGIRVNL